tara:strand:- start:506 stop:718 length:213 start_codon:yes stop_codon:yes gene_type:complete
LVGAHLNPLHDAIVIWYLNVIAARCIHAIGLSQRCNDRMHVRVVMMARAAGLIYGFVSCHRLSVLKKLMV